MTVIEELERTVRQIAERVGPAVVGITNHWGRGSGVVIAPGRVLTNAHNLRGPDATITLATAESAQGRVLGVDADGDIAVLSVETGDVAPLEWARQDTGVGIGTPVFALANPAGRGLRVTFGLVTGTERSFRGPRGRRIAGSIEHAAPLLPGSSGGPVVDSEGRLLGINTNRLGEGFYLAIPADAALKERVDALGRGEAPARPRLGIAVAPSHFARRLRRAVGLPDVEGLLVRMVEQGGAAEAAGLEEGDLVIEAGGRKVRAADDLYEALDGVEPGAPLELKLVRGTDERSVSVTLRAAS